MERIYEMTPGNARGLQPCGNETEEQYQARLTVQCVEMIFAQTQIPASVVDEAVQHGWPADLFMELIGSLPDLERAIQPPVENRPDL